VVPEAVAAEIDERYRQRIRQWSRLF
jgi:hypothetical protein